MLSCIAKISISLVCEISGVRAPDLLDDGRSPASLLSYLVL